MKKLVSSLVLAVCVPFAASAHPGHSEAVAAPIGHWTASVDHLLMLGGLLVIGAVLAFVSGRGAGVDHEDGGRDG